MGGRIPPPAEQASGPKGGAPSAAGEAEGRFQALAHNAAAAILVIDEASTIVYANPATRDIFGYPPAGLLGKPLTVLMPEELRARHEEGIRRYLATGERRLNWAGVELPARTQDGREIHVEVSFGEYEHDGERYFTGIVQDVTERVHTAEELRAALQRVRLHVDQTPLAVIDWDLELRVLNWNRGAERIFGWTAEEAIGQDWTFIVPEEARPLVDQVWEQLLARRGGERSTNPNATKDGRIIDCEWYNTPLVDEAGQVVGVASLVHDETDRRRAERQARRQLEHLNALRTIDLAITASMDLKVTLSVLLDQVMNQLQVDAADVLILNPHTRRLQFRSARGFRTEAIQETELLLGECSAGRAALERRTFSAPNLRASRDFTRSKLLQAEELIAHYATPLVAKGEVKGVLEIFQRQPFSPDGEWLKFFEALAGQAAIAVDGAQLFEDLQRSNLELALAYDTTLEGWAQAVDLRDSVTEGHTRRVTEMTLELARAIGVDDAALVHIRRGALLHDIGKIGIPDSILHKPGPLTPEEREIVEKHPVYAFEMLLPIDFLRPALDIPYAHHERWDGSGYPRKLAGEQIPLAARIFAVVDIWDALCSDRPYHDAWPEEEVREHIRTIAGTELDPQIVDTFLSMEW